MCVITRKRKLKNELLKITKINEYWYVDIDQILHGRSIYMDLSKSNFEKFKLQRRRFKISEENFVDILETLEELVEKNIK
jgi:predicted RNA-binding protein YlxR (DUF448 family)